uniref:PDZ domain-containing protein n=1 Tax=Pristionchus pacificus TaxID=54126 RepID=A0A2A6BZ11_PRIPA|eukprot:PDM71130.1 hypothetical protein PRIPAC_43513 [Pristionchus pacificus]
MTTERVVVRMSRSDPSIPWALHFSNRGADVVVSSVSPDGLSSKAGVLVNDTVVEVCGRRVNREEAERILGERKLDVDMVLTRLVTSHTCLPWNLTEKGNEVVVDHIDSRLRSTFNQDHGRSQISSATSNSSWNHPSLTQGGNYSTRNETNNYAYSNTTSTNRPHGSSSSFHSSSQSYRPPFTTTIPIYTTHSYSSNGGNQSGGYGAGVGYGSHTTNGGHQNGGYGGASYGNQTTNYNAAPAKFGGANGNGYSNGSHGVDNSSSRSIPVNQQTFIDTSNTQRGRESTLSPNRVFYHSPSSRTRRDLSPGASIHHMQYNSPMNLYSTETAAEEYSNQTGLPAE